MFKSRQIKSKHVMSGRRRIIELMVLVRLRASTMPLATPREDDRLAWG
jgi:hypothetical protein